MNIYVYEDMILRKKSKKVEEIDDNLRKTLEEMVKTMRLAKGCGLAANQVGIDGRFFVVEVNNIVKKIINPEILEFGMEMVEFEEGCLSIPGIYKKVIRPDKIKVKYFNENGKEIIEELEGVDARVFQHEYDHLDGVLFIDKISPLSKSLIRKKLEIMKKKSKPREF